MKLPRVEWTKVRRRVGEGRVRFVTSHLGGRWQDCALLSDRPNPWDGRGCQAPKSPRSYEWSQPMSLKV